MRKNTFLNMYDIILIFKFFEQISIMTFFIRHKYVTDVNVKYRWIRSTKVFMGFSKFLQNHAFKLTMTSFTMWKDDLFPLITPFTFILAVKCFIIFHTAKTSDIASATWNITIIFIILQINLPKLNPTISAYIHYNLLYIHT